MPLVSKLIEDLKKDYNPSGRIATIEIEEYHIRDAAAEMGVKLSDNDVGIILGNIHNADFCEARDDIARDFVGQWVEWRDTKGVA